MDNLVCFGMVKGKFIIVNLEMGNEKIWEIY